MSASTAVGKGAIITAAAITPYWAHMPFDMWWALFVPVGLMLGWGGRVAKLVQQRQPWSEIKRDLIVSALAGGLNALLASAIIVWFRLDYLGGVFCAALCGFEGVRAIETAVDWIRRHVINDAAALAAKREEAQRMMNENARADLERMGVHPRRRHDDD